MQGYNIYRNTDASGQYTLIGTLTVPAYTDTGLSANTTYYYKVSVFNSTGVAGPQSDPVSARTKPATPIIYDLYSVNNSISLSWGSVQGAQSYLIYRSTSASGLYTLVGASSSSSYSEYGLSTGTTYYYKVSAIADGLESELSNFISGIVYYY
jgi:fibronectin type 3 domain-containing protein